MRPPNSIAARQHVAVSAVAGPGGAGADEPSATQSRFWFSPRVDLALAVLFFGVGTAIGAWLVFVWPRPPVKYDAVEYLQLGQSLASGLGYRYGLDSYPTAYRPPLYPFLLAAGFTISGGSLHAAYLLQAVLHGATAAAAFVLARLVLPRAYALAVAMLVALSVGLTSLVGFLMTETVQAALTTAGMAATLWWLRVMAHRRAALAGLLWGLSALAKGTNLVFLALLPAALVLGWRREWRRWLPGYAAAWGVALVVLLPWTVRNWALFGRPVFVSTNVGIQVYISTLEPVTWDAGDPRLKAVFDQARAGNLNEADTDRLFLQRGLAALAANPAGLLERIVENAGRLYELPPRDAIEYLKPTVLYNDLPEYQRLVWAHYALLGMAAAGLALALAMQRRELLTLWLVPAGVVAVYAPFWVIYRFTAQALPVLYVVAVAGVWLGARALTQPRAPSRCSYGEKEGAAGPRSPDWRVGLEAGRRLAARLAHGTLALAVAASAVVWWQAHRPGWAVESEHPYRPHSDLVWAIVNPDDAATQTRVHFGAVRLAAPGDRLLLLSSDFTVLEELDPSALAAGGWTRPHPGRIIVVKLLTDGADEDWGFRVDGVDSGE